MLIYSRSDVTQSLLNFTVFYVNYYRFDSIKYHILAKCGYSSFLHFFYPEASLNSLQFLRVWMHHMWAEDPLHHLYSTCCSFAFMNYYVDMHSLYAIRSRMHWEIHVVWFFFTNIDAKSIHKNPWDKFSPDW